jgi:co-chaperonin GroES (HSP10)
MIKVIKPYSLLVEPMPLEEKLINGILHPAIKNDFEMWQGTVYEVSNSCLSAKKGDTILYTNYPIELENEGIKYHLIKETEIFAIVEL